jgi:transposase
MILGVRACMLTIRHYVTNTTDSQNAGALGDHMARPPLSARPPTDAAEERTLRRLANARHAPASLIQRARIITASWDGASVAEIAQSSGCRPKTVYKWLHRFNADGLDGLADLPRPGVPRRLTEDERGRAIQLARTQPPGRLQQGGEGLAAPADPQAPAHWTPWPVPPRPRASRWAAARSAAHPVGRAGALAADPLVGDQHRPSVRPNRLPCRRAPRRMRMGRGLAELGVPWCSKPVQKTEAWGRPGTANCCCEHVLQRR